MCLSDAWSASRDGCRRAIVGRQIRETPIQLLDLAIDLHQLLAIFSSTFDFG